jgi:hypothetical protein
VSSPADPPRDPAGLQPGPLADEHDFEYVFSIARRDDPRGNFAILRKREAAGPAAAARRPVRAAMAGRKPVKPPAAISFFVWERRYTDRERGLDFMIHAAGEDELVYWLPAQPGRMYALPKEGRARRASLGPAEDRDGGPGAEEGRRARFILHDRKDVRRGIEEEYDKMLQGEPAGPLLSPGRRP